MANPPKRNLLPFLLLLALSTVFLFSLYPTTPTLHTTSYSAATTATTTTTTTTTATNPKFTLTIKVLTFNRLNALSRCLRSLSASHYDANTVHLHIYIDHFDISSKGSQEINESLKLSREILDFVDQFEWKYGDKVVHYRTSNAGLQAQWLEAWWPSSDHDFAFVVEDDLEVSPLYFRFLKGLILNYYYNQSNFSPMIYGASLQRPRFVPGKHGNNMKLDSETRLFLYHLVGTWGQLLFPRPWKEFRLWYDSHKAEGIKPFLEGMVTTGWYKKMGERIWTPWFIKFIHARGYFNIYTNFLGERALSVSHRDAGVNYGKTAGPDSHLMDETSNDLNLLELPSLSHLKWYDFCFREVLPDRIVSNFNGLRSVLRSVQKSDTVILVTLYKTSQSIIRNLLCHFERLNIHNYMLVGPKSSFLLDLARRGHPVIDEDQFLESIRLHKSLKIPQSTPGLVKEIAVMAYVIETCLELRYTTWIVDGNMIPITTDSFSDSLDLTKDFHVGETSEFLSVRGSLSARKIWVDDFVYKVVTLVESSRRKDSVTMGDNFAYVFKQLLQQMDIKYGLFDEKQFVLNANGVDTNQTILGNTKKFVFWPSEMQSDIIQKKLIQLGLWDVDGDLSCTAVVCHPS